MQPVSVATECWPASLVSDFENVRVAVSRSMPAYRQRQPILEIESVFLALIARARRFIYAESQYFASRRIAEAIARRLEESDGPEVVLVNPVSSIGWLEPIAMDTARARLFEALRRLDRHQRLRLYHPVTAGGEAIYVHAKLMIVDDEVLHVGSSNMNNRSMRLDTECDVTIDAALEGNKQATTGIARIRASLLAEHLGVAPERIADVFSQSGSLIETVESLRSDGRSLQPYQVPNLHEVEKWLADNEVLDPNGPAEMFESLTQGKLLRGLRRHLAGLRRVAPPRPDAGRDRSRLGTACQPRNRSARQPWRSPSSKSPSGRGGVLRWLRPLSDGGWSKLSGCLRPRCSRWVASGLRQVRRKFCRTVAGFAHRRVT